MSAAADIALPRVKQAEGFRAQAYRDTMGYLTIGYGLNIDAGMSEWLAAHICELQLDMAEADCEDKPWYVAADDVRKSVLLELAFNMGLGKLLGFPHMLAACTARDWNTAADELQNSAWFHQVGNRGPRLVNLLRNGG